MEDVLESLAQQWLIAKGAERTAIEQRRRVEDLIKTHSGIDESKEGAGTMYSKTFAVKVQTRVDRKVDAGIIQEIAAENGLSAHLQTLFRWKPEINLKQWRNADESITSAFAKAITTKPSRATFQIKKREDDKK